MFNKTALLAILIALAATAAEAAPTLRSEVTVVNEVVTVGDMFDDAGVLAEKALFLAPAPGTTGLVTLAAVRSAAGRVGLADYVEEGVTRVRVVRSATPIDAPLLASLVADDLAARGFVPHGTELVTTFNQRELSFNAEAVADPVQLVELRYLPGARSFSARFQIAGIDLPVDIDGRIDLMVEVPHLATTLKAGDVLAASDIEMKQVPLEYAERTGIADLDSLVGKSLRRNARAGLLLKAADVTEPRVIARNDQVTVLFRSGPMVLSVLGLALGDASLGQPVQVLNSVTNKILFGIATGAGTIEIATPSIKLAGL